MATAQPITSEKVSPPSHLKFPLNLSDEHYIYNKYEYHEWIREHQPVMKAKVSIITTYLVSRHEDCMELLKDPRFVRNRTTAGGGSRLPFPAPKSMQLIANNMQMEG